MANNKKVSKFVIPLDKLCSLNCSSAPQELQKLNYERFHYPCPIVQKRIHRLYIKAVSGVSNEHVGIMTDAHRNSICEWIRIWRADGMGGLFDVEYAPTRACWTITRSQLKKCLNSSGPVAWMRLLSKSKNLPELSAVIAGCGPS